MTTTPATNTAVALRPAVDADTEELASIWFQGWRDGHLGHLSDEVLPHRSRESFGCRVPDQISSTTVALRQCVLVGFVTVHDDEIEQLYVAATARGTDTASVLLRHGEDLVGAHHDRAWLAVAPGNGRARRFYEREGWYDAAATDYHAAVAGGGTVVVPCRRYEKAVHRSEGGA